MNSIILVRETLALTTMPSAAGTSSAVAIDLIPLYIFLPVFLLILTWSNIFSETSIMV